MKQKKIIVGFNFFERSLIDLDGRGESCVELFSKK